MAERRSCFHSRVSSRARTACVEVAEWERSQLAEAFSAVAESELELLPGSLGDHLDELADVEVLSPFIHSRIDSAALDRLPALGLVATRSTGYDHIDLEACRRRGIAVANVPTYGENTVAEHTFALILALSRRLLAAEARGRRGDFDLDGLQGFDLKGKTLGVVGAGHIGLHVIRIGRAFEMEVLVSDPRREELIADVLGFAYVELGELLERSHVVSLHAPAVAETHHMIDSAALARVRPGALLVNTARGSLVDTVALVEALDSGRLGGAALDVFEGEELIREEHQLLVRGSDPGLRAAFGRRLLAERDDVVMTPHTAFNSIEAVERIATTTARSVAAWLAGRPINLVLDPAEDPG
jgi:D-lactate dehydrogenase